MRAIIAAQASELAAAKAGLVNKSLEIEKLNLQLARLRRMQFGQSSEKMAQAAEQMELALEELEAGAAGEAASSDSDDDADQPAAAGNDAGTTRRRGRQPLPAHLPRSEVVHPAPEACPGCGGAMRVVGEDVTEILDYIPGRFTVIRHIRPACSCRVCESMAQAPMPSLPIARGLPAPGLLAHVLVAKYCDHLPLYRQAAIYARDGVDLDRGMHLAGGHHMGGDRVDQRPDQRRRLADPVGQYDFW